MQTRLVKPKKSKANAESSTIFITSHTQNRRYQGTAITEIWQMLNFYSQQLQGIWLSKHSAAESHNLCLIRGHGLQVVLCPLCPWKVLLLTTLKVMPSFAALHIPFSPVLSLIRFDNSSLLCRFATLSGSFWCLTLPNCQNNLLWMVSTLILFMSQPHNSTPSPWKNKFNKQHLHWARYGLYRIIEQFGLVGAF